MNDPPNYDLQYALCNQYSPITGEFVGSQHSNPNLLDNAYWADEDYIIDQRYGYFAKAGTPYYTDSTWSTQVGVLEADTQLLSYTNNIGVLDINGTRYSVTDPAHNSNPIIFRGYVGSKYTIDRWYSGSQRTIVQIDENGLSLDCATGGVSYWIQYIPNASAYIGKTVTASVLLSDNTLIAQTGTVVPIPTTGHVQFANSGLQHAHARLELYTFSAGTLGYQFRIAGKFYPIAGKLELGPVQTLAHKDENGNWILNDPPPNKALELAKCQRYFVSFGQYTILYKSTLGDLTLDTPVLMRTFPAIVKQASNFTFTVAWVNQTQLLLRVPEGETAPTDDVMLASSLWLSAEL